MVFQLAWKICMMVSCIDRQSVHVDIVQVGNQCWCIYIVGWHVTACVYVYGMMVFYECLWNEMRWMDPCTNDLCLAEFTET